MKVLIADTFDETTTLSGDDFIQKADEALYLAKTKGRNKVVAYSPPA